MFGKMRDYYKILANPLGEGSFGEVRKVVFKERGVNDKNTFFKEYRACKIQPKVHMQDKDIASFENEINMQLKFGNHPNVLKTIHYFEDHHRYMQVMELVEGGELFELIQSLDGGMDSKKACQLIK